MATTTRISLSSNGNQVPANTFQIAYRPSISTDGRFGITEPSLELRLQSAKQALEALERESLRERPVAIHSKPVGSKIKVTNTRQMLEILIPSRGFYSSLIFTILAAIFWNFFLMFWYIAALATWSSGGWFLALFAMGHLYAGLCLTWSIFFTLFGKVRLHITQSTIFLSSEILGLSCLPPLTASRQIIEKIELTRSSYKSAPEGGHIKVPLQINIWAGTKQFSLGSKNSWQDYSLTAPELDWLAQELSIWLGLPIIQD